MTRGRGIRRALTAVALFLALGTGRAATITVVNLDGAGEGFNDPTTAAPLGGNTGVTLGAQRLNVFQYAADLWGAQLASTVLVRVGANMDPLTCSASSAILGQAGPNTIHANFSGAPFAGTWYPQALANKLAGTDLSAAQDDIGATFNSAMGTTCPFPSTWYYGLDGNPPGGGIDFVSVVLHEISHGLGFLTFVDETTGARLGNRDDVYMKHLEDHSTGLGWPAMTDAQRAASAKDTGDLHWTGSAVVANSGILTTGRDVGSGHVEMYAPNPVEGVSSVSHWSTTCAPNELMEPMYTGPLHAASLARHLMTDLGWGAETGSTTTTSSTTSTTSSTSTSTSSSTTSSTSTSSTTSTSTTTSSTVPPPPSTSTSTSSSTTSSTSSSSTSTSSSTTTTTSSTTTSSTVPPPPSTSTSTSSSTSPASTTSTSTSTSSTLSATTSTSSTTLPGQGYSGCPPVPRSTCRASASQHSLLILHGGADATRRALRWKISRGGAATVANLRDPASGSPTVEVCLYDTSSAAQPLLDGSVVQGGGCGTSPCWKALGGTGGVRYKNRAATPDGLTEVKLSISGIGELQLLVKGKGANLRMPALGIETPVTVQLAISDSDGITCWDATFTGALRNDATVFRAGSR